MNLFSLSAILSLDKRGFDKGVKDADQQGRGLAGKLSAWTIAGGKMIADYAEKAVGAVISTGKRAMSLYGDLEQQMGGVQAVFRTFNKNVEAAADEAWKYMGLSKTKYLEEANKMGSLLQGMGFTEEKSAEMTINWMQRAADVASIMGIRTEDAMTAIEGAAKGNFTMMDNLGVAMNATTLEAYALSKGIKKSYSAMSQDEKIGLAYQMFMEKTAKYAGNFNKENDTLVGGMASLSAAWENLLSGTWLSEENPTVRATKEQEVIDGLAVAAENAFNQMLSTAGKLFPAIWDAAKRIVVKLWPKVTALLSGFIKDLPKTLDSAIEALAKGAIDLINGIFGTDLKLGDFKLPSISDLVDKVKTWWTKYGIGEHISKVCDWFLGLFKAPGDPDRTTLKEVLDDWWPKVSAMVTDLCDWVLGMFTGVADTDSEGRTPAQIVGDWFSNISKDIAGACEWVLELFGLPNSEEASAKVEGFLNDNVKAVGDLFEWALSLPSLPPEEASNELGQKVGEWLGTIIKAAVDLGLWVLGAPDLEDPNTTPEEKIEQWAQSIQGWVDRATAKLNLVLNFGVGLLGYDSPEQFAADIERRLVIAWADLLDATGIGGALGIDMDKMRKDANNVYERKMKIGFEMADPWSKEFSSELDMAMGPYTQQSGYTQYKADFMKMFSEGSRSDEDRNAQLAKWGNGSLAGKYEFVGGALMVKSDNAEIEETEKQLDETKKKVEELDGSSFTINGNIDLGGTDGDTATPNAKGLDFVPTNDYLTRLHRGEAVLSANEARAWRESGGRGQGYGGAGAIVSAIQGLSSDMQNLRLYVGERAFAGAVVDYSGRRMNNYLGESSTRARRGYGRR